MVVEDEKGCEKVEKQEKEYPSAAITLLVQAPTPPSNPRLPSRSS